MPGSGLRLGRQGPGRDIQHHGQPERDHLAPHPAVEDIGSRAQLGAGSAPSTQAPATSAAPATASTAAASGSGSSLLWLWILLAAVVVIVVAVLIARRSGRRSATTADWRSRTIDVYARGSALYDAMSAAEAPGALAAADAPARWADIQRRADDLTQELYALRESARGELNRGRVEDVLGSLQAVRSAMAAERGQAGVGAPQSGRVYALLRDFEARLRELRDPTGQQF